MGYASISGRAITNPDSPKAFGVCDRCGIWYNHCNLSWQFDYRGRSLANIRILVCDRCNDDPQPQLKPRIIPPDPLPIANSRVEQFCYDEVDERTTNNPALPPVDFGTSAPIQLSGLQFIDGHQLQVGELVLVKNQTNLAENGIYKAATGVWVRQGYDNANQRYIPAATIDTSWSNGILYLQQLGIYLGAVYVARGINLGKLYQIDFPDTSGVVGIDGIVANSDIPASYVNRYDLFTGIYMAGITYTRVTQEDYVRTPQQVGQASGNINEIPGYSNLVPGFCDIGRPDEVPYGCATRQGLPPSMDVLPFSGALWPTLSNQSVGVWLNSFGLPAVWANDLSMEVTFKSLGFWPNPGPGAPFRPIEFTADYHQWVNNFGQNAYWNNTLGQNVLWRQGVIYGVFPPGGDILWYNDKCVLTLWNNDSGNNVNWAEIYPNALPPNKPAPWPWGWM
jgi:hypothetical protein